MRQYQVTGMSCAACSARVEKAVSKVPGVDSCSVSLLTNSMGVEGNADPETIINAVKEAGYGASLNDATVRTSNTAPASDAEEALEDHETPVLKRRLCWSLGFLVVLMYFSMGHSMWGWPLPEFFENNHVAMGLVQMILAMIVMIINQKFFISGFRSLIHGAPNMDTLVALGAAASFGWSVYVLFAMTQAQVTGGSEAAMKYMHEFYFESAAMILTLITVGKMLEARSKGKTTDALKSLMKLSPKTAIVLRSENSISSDNAAGSDIRIEGNNSTEKANTADKNKGAEWDGDPEIEVEVEISRVKKGDIFIVRPGSNVPVDGVVIYGSSAVDESALTGESIPVDKVQGDKVSAGTVNQSGYMRCRATHVGEDTSLAQIIKLVSDAAATKAPIAKVADRVSGVFVPVVIGIALITLVVWLLTGQTAGFALARAISVLVISCPCALGLATPVAIMVGSGVGARNGVLFKTAVSLEETGKVSTVVLDKTGTITKGEPQVTDIMPASGVSEEELLDLAVVLERRSEHPLAKAITEYTVSSKSGYADRSRYENKCMSDGVNIGANDSAIKSANNGGDVSVKEEAKGIDDGLVDFKILPGNGLEAVRDGEKICGGNLDLISGSTNVPAEAAESAGKLAEEGKTCLFFGRGSEYMGMIAVADVIKEESPRAINELKGMGIDVVMLTGDNELTAKAIGRQAGVSNVIAQVLPDGKAAEISRLKRKGETEDNKRNGVAEDNSANEPGGNRVNDAVKVAMVGDGINDAPALVSADTGIAIGAGTDVAIDAGDVVLMKSTLTDVPAAIRLSRQTLRNIHQNLFWAFFYNIIGIPLAAGVWIPVFGWTLNPMFGAAAMSLSSFCVVTNALRLNFFNMHDASKDKRSSKKQTDRITAQRISKDDNTSVKGERDNTTASEGNDNTSGNGENEVFAAGTDRANNEEKEKNKMEKTMKIEGMMCPHCEAAVKGALESLEGVSEAKVSHEADQAVVVMESEVSDAALKEAVEAKDYTVVSID